MSKIKASACFLVTIFFSVITFSHHGGSMYPDRETELIFDNAIIDELLFVNPHARLLFSWTDSDGNTAVWDGELSGSNELVRSGVYSDLVEPGDRVTIKAWAHSSIPRNLRLVSIILPNGQEVPLP
ncbi:MAG: hypothetical protein CMM56_08700 [Rhodospirillaceae bacterium]|nr:hypothetical protein [Rhodospirillaceae bacterium]